MKNNLKKSISVMLAVITLLVMVSTTVSASALDAQSTDIQQIEDGSIETPDGYINPHLLQYHVVLEKSPTACADKWYCPYGWKYTYHVIVYTYQGFRYIGMTESEWSMNASFTIPAYGGAWVYVYGTSFTVAGPYVDPLYESGYASVVYVP